MATGTPNYANGAVQNGIGAVVRIGDASRTAPVNLVNVLTPGSNGTRIERVSFDALGPINLATVLRLFLVDNSSVPHLYAEIPVPQYPLQAGVPGWMTTLEAVNHPELVPLLVKTGWSLGATINDTLIAQELSVNSIAGSQTLGASGFLSLNGANVTGASTTAIAAAAAPSSGTPMTLTSGPYVLPTPAQVTLTSAANASAVNFLILGRDLTGTLISETLAGPNANTVAAVNVYGAVYAVIPASSSASTVSVGYSAVAGATILPLPSKVMLTSGGNLSGVNFTVKGTASNGTVQSETLSGPNVGEVQSASLYASITSIAANAAVSSGIMVGNPPIMSGISILVNGGDF